MCRIRAADLRAATATLDPCASRSSRWQGRRIRRRNPWPSCLPCGESAFWPRRRQGGTEVASAGSTAPPTTEALFRRILGSTSGDREIFTHQCEKGLPRGLDFRPNLSDSCLCRETRRRAGRSIGHGPSPRPLGRLGEPNDFAARRAGIRTGPALAGTGAFTVRRAEHDGRYVDFRAAGGFPQSASVIMVDTWCAPLPPQPARKPSQVSSIHVQAAPSVSRDRSAALPLRGHVDDRHLHSHRPDRRHAARVGR
jgi:hypothetical protein